LLTNQLNILVADDHKIMRTIMGQIIKAIGCETARFAKDGAEAFREIVSFPPDIAIIDLQMPHDGLSLLKDIRRGAASPDPTLPVIMMTSLTNRRTVLAARDAGATEILGKPFTPEAILSRVASVIDHPRTFVRSANFVGPDRRRAGLRDYAGPFRRIDDVMGPVFL
jgi:DNA-binding response OmpR family regulator